VSEFDSLSKCKLHALADGLLKCENDAIEKCIAFIEADTRGLWHGRARAMMSRRLKQCPLSGSQRERLLRVITHRLETGNFSEQFKDQLRLALHFDAPRLCKAALACQGVSTEHIRRYGAWILVHHSADAPS
jgi:hypothetical protein